MRAWSWCVVAALCVCAPGCDRQKEASPAQAGGAAASTSTSRPLELGEGDAAFVDAPRALGARARSDAIREQVRARASSKKLMVRPPSDAGEEPPRGATELARVLGLPGPALSSDAPTSDLELTALYVALARRAGLDGVVLTQTESQVPGTGRGLMAGGYTRDGETRAAPMVRDGLPSMIELEVMTDVEFEGLHMAEGAMAALNRNVSGRAVELARRATERAPRRAYTWTTLSYALERKEDVFGALRAIDRALEVRQTRALKARKAELMTASGAAAEALTFVESALAEAPADPDLLHALGLTACALGDASRAADAFEGSGREGSRWEGWRDAALVSLAASDPARALAAIREGRRIHEDPGLWDALASASGEERAKWPTRTRRLAEELGECAEAE